MDASHGAGPAGAHPADVWDQVVAAATGSPSAGPVAQLASVEGVPRLGWVHPPPWPRVIEALAPAAGLLRAPRLLLLTTGGWAFAARMLAAAAAPRDRLRVCDLLDPESVELAASGHPRPAVLAVSQSGVTPETVALADLVEQRLSLPVQWLTGDAVALDATGPPTTLFAAPVSVPFLLAAALTTGSDGTDGMPAVYAAYQEFTAHTDAIGRWAAEAAGRVPSGPSRVRVELPRGSSTGLLLYAMQALRQGLGGKRGAAAPWLDVTVTGTGTAPPGADMVVRLPADTGCRQRLSRLMARCYAVSALVSCIGVRHEIAFAGRPAIARYQRLLSRSRPVAVTVPPAHIVRRSAAWLRQHGLSAGHLVCYEPRLVRRLARARAALTAASGRPWEVHAGSAWNHHSYQAVQAEDRVGVVAVIPAAVGHPLSRRQAEIAAATCASLGGRGLLLRPDPRAVPE